MRMLVTWIVTLVLISMVAFSWYITQPIIGKIVNVADEVMQGGGWNSTLSSQTFTILGYIALWWGPIVVLAILLWAFISGQQRDVESEMYA